MSRRNHLATLLAASALLAACTAGDPAAPVRAEPARAQTSAPSASPSGRATPQDVAPGVEVDERPDPARRRPRLDSWPIGEHTLPLRPDGFGEVRRTPPQLRDRRMPTVDELPAPPDARWRGSVRSIGPVVRERMGTSWQPGCPVGLRILRYLRLTFWGFDRAPHTGELIVHADHARNVLGVFRRLYAARFPIEQMTLPTSVEFDPTPSGDGNGTGGMACRPARGSSSLSAHAYGLAVDLNPFHNPYHRDDLVLPERASAYLDRSWRRPGMVHPDSLAVREFARIGWSWGGDWTSLKDYQHFTATGR